MQSLKRYEASQNFVNETLLRKQKCKRIVVKIGSSLFHSDKDKLDANLING